MANDYGFLAAGARLIGRGKVRDIFETADGLILLATDRISAFDVVFPDPIPDKGRVLTQLSAFWFEKTAGEIPNHFITADPESFPKPLQAAALAAQGRAMLVRRAGVLPVECVVRGYLAGSAWAEYRKCGRAFGYALPAGLREGDALPEPIFTPTTKETGGHDRPLEPGELRNIVGSETAHRLAEMSLTLFRFGAAHASTRGIVLADTKFEFGWLDGELILVDEILTPDSSRFWPADHYRPGAAIPSFDKQFLRDYVENIGWDKNPPAPKLPEDVIVRTRQKYLEALERLTGRPLAA